MDSGNFINSPVIQKNTPIKRLGLSRKRKSSGSVGEYSRLEKKAKEVNEPEIDSDNNVNHLVDYKKEIEALKTKISEKEEKLKTSQVNNKNILELEDLIKLWKIGCKNAYLEFMHLLKVKEPNINIKDVLNKLGILETMLKHFENDCDISLSLNCS